jgi:DNA polymerase-3 subunit alpha
MAKDLENIEKLLARFKRQIPEGTQYEQRLVEEFELIINLRFTDYFLQICDIIDLTTDIKHMTRGSAGSSLVCYLLGITDVDPIKWKIPVARFMNPLRDDLPDVDIDFEHWRQLEVMNRIFKKWPGKTARLSNYVTFKQKSAKREAAKRLGATGRLPRNFTYESLGVDPVEAKRIERKLLGKKRAISKHCGGIVMFTRQLPKSLISQDNQILLDKHEVEDLEHLKVDILANRGLSQLLEIDPHTALEDYPEYDDQAAALLARGDVLGVTQGESPAMRRLFRAIQPTGVHDCVFATAMVRPVAMSGRQKAAVFQDWSQETMQDSIVFEDDAIEIISSIIGVDAYEADSYRRAFAKKHDEKILEFVERMGNNPKRAQAMAALQELSGFGLCRAHAVNLGRLIWALAYQKAHNPEAFWRANLKHCQGSYRGWVYQTEAHRRDILTEPGWWHRGFPQGLGVQQKYLERVNFAGVIANGRTFRGKTGRYVTFLTLGTNYGEYVDVTIQRPFQYRDGDIVSGSGVVRHQNNSDYINCTDAKLWTFSEWRKNIYQE